VPTAPFFHTLNQFGTSHDNLVEKYISLFTIDKEG